MRDPATDPYGEEADKLRIELEEEEQLVQDFDRLKRIFRSSGLNNSLVCLGWLYARKDMDNLHDDCDYDYERATVVFAEAYGWPCTFHCFAEAVKDEEAFRKDAVARC